MLLLKLDKFLKIRFVNNNKNKDFLESKKNNFINLDKDNNNKYKINKIIINKIIIIKL